MQTGSPFRDDILREENEVVRLPRPPLVANLRVRKLAIRRQLEKIFACVLPDVTQQRRIFAMSRAYPIDPRAAFPFVTNRTVRPEPGRRRVRRLVDQIVLHPSDSSETACDRADELRLPVECARIEIRIRSAERRRQKRKKGETDDDVVLRGGLNVRIQGPQ